MSDLSALVATGLGLLEEYVSAHNAWVAAESLDSATSLRLAIVADDAKKAYRQWLYDNARALLEGCAAMEQRAEADRGAADKLAGLADTVAGALRNTGMQGDGITLNTDLREHVWCLSYKANEYRAERDAALVDARRYRWLRDECRDVDICAGWGFMAGMRDDPPGVNSYDAAIDAAMGAPSTETSAWRPDDH